jgi:nitrogen fixation protein FixH
VIEIGMAMPVAHAVDASQVTAAANTAHVADVTSVSDAASAPAVTGTVTLYRPSDRTADRVVPLSLDAEGRQQIRVEGPAAHGRWTVKLAWRAGQREFYREQIVWLP